MRFEENAFDRHPFFFFGLGIVLLVLLGWGVTWFRASMEASSYNRVTGANVTTWDAIWLDLRVQEDSSPD